MSTVKSFAVGSGDMFYIRHGSDNFTIIDCCLPDANPDVILDELESERLGKGITRFISTHPDDDHIRGLCELDATLGLRNFYCVDNETTKPDWTADFERYGELRDSSGKAFHIYKGCTRRWMNQSTDERGSAGINVLWPVRTNAFFKAELARTKAGGSPNNISCILTYSLNGGNTIMWMGDLQSEFMELVKEEVEMPPVDILFAPHHGRDTPPKQWLDAMNPQMVVLGDAAAEHLDPYSGFNKLRQSLAGDIVLECHVGKTHVYVGSSTYSVDFLTKEHVGNNYERYIGTLYCG